ncbi:hypothetical protein HDV02_003517 [Globomyces sp. JEL0801]|nr:hypothetical protein HDV02_003517 [Globomyces sp. JEL0801]
MEGSARNIMNYHEQLLMFHEQQGVEFEHPIINNKPVDLLLLKKKVYTTCDLQNLDNINHWGAVAQALGFDNRSLHTLKLAFIKWILPYEEYIQKHENSKATGARSHAIVTDRIAQHIPIEKDSQIKNDASNQSNVYISKSEIFDDNVNNESRSDDVKVKLERVGFKLLTDENKDNSGDSGDSKENHQSNNNLTQSNKDIDLEKKPSNLQKIESRNTRKRNPSNGSESNRELNGQDSSENQTLPQQSRYKHSRTSVDNGVQSEKMQLRRSSRYTSQTSDPTDSEGPRRSSRYSSSDVNNTKQSSRNTKQLNSTPTKKLSNLNVTYTPTKTPTRKKNFMAKGFETCEICYLGSEVGQLVICDECEGATHLTCLSPKLDSIPLCEWMCHRCLKDHGKDYGFEDTKELRNLVEFQKISENFKENWFKSRYNKSPKHVSENEFEQEFWRVISSPYEDVEVEYGADLHSSVHGSNSFTVGGDTKTWYGIPDSSADLFEKTMREQVPELFHKNPDLLFHLTTLMSPKLLIEKGVKVFGLDQRAGEFVVTFPRAYHSGLNHGFNFCEAVNFSPPDWIPYGKDCVDLYSKFSKQPVFSHDELLVVTAQSKIDPELARYLKPAFEKMRLEEYQKRQSILNRFSIKQEFVEPSPNDNELLHCCKHCKSFCYLSSIKCFQHPETLLCLSHVDVRLANCCCKPSNRVLEIQFTQKTLDELQTKIDDRVVVSTEWVKQLEDLYNREPSPTLKQLNEILKASQKIHLDISETKDLVVFIQTCQSWCDKVSTIVNPARQISKTNHITIDTIESLLNEKKKLPFHAPQLPELVKLSETLTQLKSRVELALNHQDTIPIANLIQLSEQFEDLDIGDPIVDKLKRLIDKKKWSQKYSDVNNFDQYTLEELTNLVKDAQRLGIEANILELMKRRVSEGQLWNDRTRERLESSELTLKDLESMLLEFTRYATSPALIAKIKQLVNQVYTSLQRVQSYLDRAQLQSYQSLSEAKADDIDGIIAFIESCKRIPCPKTPLDLLSKRCNESRLWKYQLKSMFNARSDNYLDLLDESISIASRSNEYEVCICNNTKSISSLHRCSVCKIGYHRECLNITKRELQTEFVGPCCQQIDLYNPKKYPSVKAVTEHLASALKNPLINPDAVYLAKLLPRVEVWQENVRNEITAAQGKVSNAKLLEYLRRSWGIRLQLPISSFLLNTISKLKSKAKTESISHSKKRNWETQPPPTNVDSSYNTSLDNRRANFLKKRKMNSIRKDTGHMEPNTYEKMGFILDDQSRERTSSPIYSDHAVDNPSSSLRDHPQTEYNHRPPTQHHHHPDYYNHPYHHPIPPPHYPSYPHYYHMYPHHPPPPPSAPPTSHAYQPPYRLPPIQLPSYQSDSPHHDSSPYYSNTNE